MLHRAGAIVIAGSVALAGFAASARAGDISPERQHQLSYLVLEDCGSCHGMTLKGGLGKPLRATDLKHLGVGTITRVILNGVPGTPMPPWRGLLAEDEARWIAEALKEGTIK